MLLLSEEGAPLPRPSWEVGLLLWAELLPEKHVGADASAYVSIRHTSASITALATPASHLRRRSGLCGSGRRGGSASAK